MQNSAGQESRQPASDHSLVWRDRLAVLSSNPIIQTDRAGLTTWVSPSFETLTGYAAAEAIGRTPGSLLQCPQTDPATVAAIGAALRAQVPIKAQILNRSKAGHHYWLDLEIRPILSSDGELEGFLAIQTDITAIMEAKEHGRAALEAVSASEAILSTVADLAGVGNWVLDCATNRVTWSQQARRILGRGVGPERTATIGRFIALFDQPSRAIVRSALRHALKHAQPLEFELPLETLEDEARWIRVVGRPLLSDTGGTRLVGALQDVTAQRHERERLQVALDAARQALGDRAAYQEALDRFAIVAFTGPKGEIQHVNDHFCEASGYSREELLGEDYRFLDSGLHPRAFFDDLVQSISLGRPWHAEVCNRRKTGELYWLDTTVVPLLDSEGRPELVATIQYDITNRKTAEQDRAALVSELEDRRIAAEAANCAAAWKKDPLSGVIGA